MSVWIKINIKTQVGIDFGGQFGQGLVKVTPAKNRKGVVWKPGLMALLFFL